MKKQEAFELAEKIAYGAKDEAQKGGALAVIVIVANEDGMTTAGIGEGYVIAAVCDVLDRGTKSKMEVMMPVTPIGKT